MPRTMSEAEIEREQVEWVFGLTGGELNDGPFIYHTMSNYSGWVEHQHLYWYDGCPDYVDRAERQEWEETDAVTLVVAGGGYLSPPSPWIVTDRGAWVLVATYTSSGEAECPLRDVEDGEGEDVGRGLVEDGRCYLCEARIIGTVDNPPEGHGYIYTGDGYEAVYSLVEESETERDEWEQCEHCKRVVMVGDGEIVEGENDLNQERFYCTRCAPMEVE